MATPADNRFAPPKSHVADVSSDDASELASRWARLGAALLDGLLIFLPLIPAYAVILPGLIRLGPNASSNAIVQEFTQRAAGLALFGLAGVLLVFVIDIVFIAKYSQTIGKRILKIKVVRTDGSRASFSRIFWLRGFVNGLIGGVLRLILPIIGGLYSLVDLLFIFGSSKRCVHDYIADTIVVKA